MRQAPIDQREPDQGETEEPELVRSGQSPEELRGQRNRSILITLGMLFAVTLLMVSTLPAVLIPPALSQLLLYASLGVIVVAAFRRDPLFPGHLTHWDQAAVLTLLSLAAGAFTDFESLTLFLESQAAGAVGPG